MFLLRIVTFVLYVVLLGWLGCSVPLGDSDGGQTDGSADARSDDAASADAAGGDEFCPVVEYAPCGGDLVGTWAFRSLCPDDPVAAAALCEHPYDNQPLCTGTGNEAICDGTPSGTLTFNADLSIDIDTQISLVMTWNFTDACLEAAVSTGGTAQQRCLSIANDHLSCSYDGHCKCVSEPMLDTTVNTATYEVIDSEVTLGDDPPSTYCVSGDRLTMDYYLYHPVSWRYWVLERE